MSTCPFCQTNLSDRSLTEGHCPACGNLVTWTEDEPPVAEAPPTAGRPKTPSWSPPDTDDPVTLLKATLERIASRDAEGDAAQPIPPLVPAGTAPSGPRHGGESGTMDFTLTPPDLAALSAAAESVSGAGSEAGRPTIVDSAALAATPPVDLGKKTKRGSDTPTLIPTIVPPGGKRPSTYDDRRFAATMDSGSIPAEDTEHVAKLWQGTYTPTCTPRTSLKGSEAFRARDFETRDQASRAPRGGGDDQAHRRRLRAADPDRRRGDGRRLFRPPGLDRPQRGGQDAQARHRQSRRATREVSLRSGRDRRPRPSEHRPDLRPRGERSRRRSSIR